MKSRHVCARQILSPRPSKAPSCIVQNHTRISRTTAMKMLSLRKTIYGSQSIGCTSNVSWLGFLFHLPRRGPNTSPEHKTITKLAKEPTLWLYCQHKRGMTGRSAEPRRGCPRYASGPLSAWACLGPFTKSLLRRKVTKIISQSRSSKKQTSREDSPV